MRRLICLVSCMVAIIFLLSGCGNKSEGLTIPKRQVQNGGQLVYGSLQEPNTLNPLLSDFLSTAEVGSLIFSGLIISNDKGELVPDLAISVPTVQNGGVSRDGLVVTYQLRQGVTWHDGVPLSAEDVKFTWKTIVDPKNNIVNRDGYDKIADIETPTPYTVVIRFKEYYAPHLTLFTTILPKHALGGAKDINKATFNRNPIGTGPFKLKEWRVAEAIILDANLNYFRGRPKLDTVVYKIIPEPSLLIARLKTGEIDAVSNISFSQLDHIKAIGTVNTVLSPNLIWEHIDFNLDNPLFQDVKVRQAIALAIDRQAIVNNVLKNAASPAAADQSPLSWAYNPALKAPARDVNAARALLSQAGWMPGTNGILSKNGQTLTFTLVTTAKDRIREVVAQSIVEQLKEIGIVVEVRFVEAATLFDDVLKNRRFDTVMYAWVTGMDPDNFSFWNSKRIPGYVNGFTGQNYAGWRNPEVDALTEQGLRTVDIEGRKQIYFRIQDIISQEYPVIPLYFRTNIDVVKPAVANFRPNPTPAGNFWNVWEWGYYEK